MITIPETVERLVRNSPLLEDALARGWLNLSAVARALRPEIERELQKKIQDGAVTIALHRLAGKRSLRAKPMKRLFRTAPDLMVRSNLFEVTYANTTGFFLRQTKLLEKPGASTAPFLTVTRGIRETTIIAGLVLRERVLAVFRDIPRIALLDHLSSVTVLLPPGTALIPGVYSYILKALAWDGIPVVEVVSTSNEFTIVFEDRNIDPAFGLIKRLF